MAHRIIRPRKSSAVSDVAVCLTWPLCSSNRGHQPRTGRGEAEAQERRPERFRGRNLARQGWTRPRRQAQIPRQLRCRWSSYSGRFRRPPLTQAYQPESDDDGDDGVVFLREVLRHKSPSDDGDDGELDVYEDELESEEEKVTFGWISDDD